MHDTIVEPSLPVGFVLQSYEIKEVLGVGGFGITYLGVHRQLRKKVAIKEFMPRDFSYRDTSYQIRPSGGSAANNKSAGIFNYGLGRFLKEAQDLVRFQHPHIVKATDYFEFHGTAYIVMDYVQGQTLERWLTSHGAPPNEESLKAIFLPLLDGLNEVHNYGLLHRDIKPDNIYIQENGLPLLIDFGAARSAVGSRSRSIHVVVAEGYSPKEQYATSGKQGPWTDIYAIGATLLRCIAQQVPISSMDRSEAFDHEEPDPMICASQEFKGKYSDSFLNTIDHCLCFSGQDRPQTVREVQDGLLGSSVFVKPLDTERPSRRIRGVDEQQPVVSARIDPIHSTPEQMSDLIAPSDQLAPTFIADQDWTESKVGPYPGRSQDRHKEEPLPAQSATSGKRFGWLPWVAVPIMLVSIAGLLHSLGVVDTLIRQVKQSAPTSTSPTPTATATPTVQNDPPQVNSDNFETMLARVQEADRQLRSVGAVISEGDQEKLVEVRNRAESLGNQREYDEAASLLELSLEHLKTLRLTANRNVRIGSSSDGIDNALQQCRDYYGEQNCSPAWYEEERARQVQLKPFSMSSSEVSFSEFARFAEEQNYVTHAESRGWSLQLMSNHDVQSLDGYNWRQPEGPSSSWQDFSENPVAHISQADARAYCSWASARLPTCAEWEYASSGGKDRMFADYFDKAQYSADQADSQTLASVPANSRSVYDVQSKLFGITGNVWEWTSSLQGGSGKKYYVKGGSWKEAAVVNLRFAALRPEYPADSYIDVGFRCAMDTERWP